MRGAWKSRNSRSDGVGSFWFKSALFAVRFPKTRPVYDRNRDACNRFSQCAGRRGEAARVQTLNGMDYVLTCNCTQIANAAIRDKIERTCREAGFEPPIICTPEEVVE